MEEIYARAEKSALWKPVLKLNLIELTFVASREAYERFKFFVRTGLY